MTTIPLSPLLSTRALLVYQIFAHSLSLPGDVAECGVVGGEISLELVSHVETFGFAKIIHLFDTFEGLPDLLAPEDRPERVGSAGILGSYRVPLQDVQARFAGHRLKPEVL